MCKFGGAQRWENDPRPNTEVLVKINVSHLLLRSATSLLSTELSAARTLLYWICTATVQSAECV